MQDVVKLPIMSAKVLPKSLLMISHFFFTLKVRKGWLNMENVHPSKSSRKHFSPKINGHVTIKF